MLWWISWTRFVLATVSRYYLKNTMIDKKNQSYVVFYSPEFKEFSLAARVLFSEYSIKRLEISRVLLGNEHKQNSIQLFHKY